MICTTVQWIVWSLVKVPSAAISSRGLTPRPQCPTTIRTVFRDFHTPTIGVTTAVQQAHVAPYLVVTSVDFVLAFNLILRPFLARNLLFYRLLSRQ